jgi:hypothetical protein
MAGGAMIVLHACATLVTCGLYLVVLLFVLALGDGVVKGYVCQRCGEIN